MPIVVTCPGCPAMLSAPDDAAGKQIRCPKCGTIATLPALIPAEEVPIVDAAVVSQKPKKPIQAEIDEDEDDRPQKSSREDRDEDEDERPRKKKKKRYADDDDHERDLPKRKRKSGRGPVIALIIVGGLLLLVVGGGIYFLAGKKSPFAKKASPPSGWEEYKYPEDGFQAYMPHNPARMSVTAGGFQFGGRGAGMFNGDELQEMESVSAYASGNVSDPVRVEIVVIRFRSSVPASMRNRTREMIPGDGETRSVQWLGASGEERTTRAAVIRSVCTDRSVIVATITGANGSRASPAVEGGFFDNFELTK